MVRASMSSVEIPYSIAAALPSLVVLDITNDVRQEVQRSGLEHGIAYVFAGRDGIVRVNERESGFFDDLARMLERLVPGTTEERERLLAFLLGPRGEQVPFAEGELCLGEWQRILLFSFGEDPLPDWKSTLVG
jgi:thiamine phosphate synthase YjbQ (UPF0047 family)